MFDAVHLANRLKTRVLMRYVRGLERLDPQVARHLLSSQREFFLAGKTFFESEAGHAQKAINKMERKMKQS